MNSDNTDHQLLRALASGATVSELRQLMEEPGMVEVSKESTNYALQIRLQLDDLVERERNLAHLVSSLRDLAGLDAVEGVLHSIVSRSRQLLMADVAYFLTFDGASDMASMHVSEGIISDAFSQLQVPPEEGISGFIAATKKPSWTSDYMTDTRYRHNDAIDSATTEEGLRAILGVPVIRSGRVVGLLLAADRHKHDFRPQDVELLFSLAQHAGVVIENATLHEQGQQTVERLEETVHALESGGLATRMILQFQDRLLALLMTEGTIQDLARLVQTTLGGTVVVGDDQNRVLARAGHDTSPIKTEFGWSVEPLGSDPSSLGFVAHVAERAGQGPGVADQRQILGRAATVAALMVSRLHTDLNTARENAAKLLTALLKNPADEHLAVLKSMVAIDIDSLNTVLVVAPESDAQSSQLIRAAQHLAERSMGLASALENEVLIWLPADDPRKAAQQVAASLTAAIGTPVTVGAALTTGSKDLALAARDGHNTLRTLRALGRDGEGAAAADVAPFPTILANSSHEELENFVREAIGILLAYDEKNGTDMLLTLKAVYENASNVTAAAESLFVHANTVHQRLARIDQMTGESWRRGDVALMRQLAIRVRALMNSEVISTQSADLRKGTT